MNLKCTFMVIQSFDLCFAHKMVKPFLTTVNSHQSPQILTQNNYMADVMGFVLFIEPKRTTTKRDGSQVDVREIVIIDHSIKSPMMVSMWGDFASEEYNRICIGSVIGITSLKVSNYKVFSLGTSMSTRFIFEPTGDKATHMVNWYAFYFKSFSCVRCKFCISVIYFLIITGLMITVICLIKKKERVQEVRLSKAMPKLVNIGELKKKKVDDTMIDEDAWLCGHIVEFENKKWLGYT